MKQIKWIIKLFTILGTYGLFLVLGFLFVGMFINGGTILVDCTQFGEDVFEYPLMAILLPIFTYGTYLNYKELTNVKDELRETETTRTKRLH